MAAILLLALLSNPVPALSLTLPGYSVTLVWDASPSPEVTGYRIHLGVASGSYTNSRAVGNATTNLVPGLVGATTYFFAISAYDASGLESTLSNEISYTTPTGLPTVRLRVASSGQVVLTLGGRVGHTYDVQATPDLETWTVIGTVAIEASGSAVFIDPQATDFPERFYRTRDTQP